MNRLLIIAKFPIAALTWPTPGLRRASVNSFGFGGANTHVVLDDAYNYLRLRNLQGRHVTTKNPSVVNSHKLPLAKSVNGKLPKLLVWSAADEDGLNRLSATYFKHLDNIAHTHNNEDYLADLAWTLAEKRSRLPWKSFIIVESTDSLLVKLAVGFQERVRSHR
jgi:acyl transferase domain-containing protein